jgi:predicted SnoaL-like aldol condensation-catalyzing enzyme
VFFDKDISVIDRYFSDDFIQHDPDFPNGKGPIFQLPSLGIEFEPGMVIAQGDLVGIHARITGLEPEVLIAFWIFRVENGLIAEFWTVAPRQPEVPANETVSGNPMFEPVPDALGI